MFDPPGRGKAWGAGLLYNPQPSKHPRAHGFARYFPLSQHPIRKVLRGVAMTPLWLAQLLYATKSYEANPILGNRLLNRLGLHVLRVLLAHGITRLRWWLMTPLLPREQRRAFHRQGYLLIPDFLPAEQFAALDREVRGYRGEVRECVQGDTQNHRTLLDPASLRDLPACRALLADRRYRHALQWTAARLGLPLVFIEQVRNGFVAGGGDDPQKHLHADTFHPTMKAWLFLDDVPESRGPFSYVPGSNRLTWRRLAWEYRQSVQGRDLPDRYARRGSPRLSETDRAALGLPEATRFAVPANTVVIANTFGFHARSAVTEPCTRLAIYADSRTNPFNPWPGLDLPWLNRLKYAVFQQLRRRQDRRAARRGGLASWHRVDDAPGEDRTATDG